MDLDSEFESIVEPVRDDVPSERDIEFEEEQTDVEDAAILAALYWSTLVREDVPPTDATNLTQTWMWTRVDYYGEDED